jgi:DNA modification methylase
MCDETYATRIANLPERFSADERDFGNILDYEMFLAKIYHLCRKVHRVLKDQKYFVLFCKDEYQNGEYIEKSSALAQVAKTAGFAWKGKIVWYQAGAKLRPYGVPYSFVPNLTHQCILVFKKNGQETDSESTEGIPEVEERQTIVRP